MDAINGCPASGRFCQRWGFALFPVAFAVRIFQLLPAKLVIPTREHSETGGICCCTPAHV